MSELHEVEIAIAPNGDVRVEVRGMKGPGCLEVTREMETLLGAVVLERDHTHEFDLEPDADAQSDWLRGRD